MSRQVDCYTVPVVGKSCGTHVNANYSKNYEERQKQVLRPVDFPHGVMETKFSLPIHDNFGANIAPGRLYTHNPYASLRPVMMCSSSDTSQHVNTSNNTSCASSAPTHISRAPRDAVSAEESVVTGSSLGEFFAIVGDIPAKACTVAGRHLLVSVIRFHPEKIRVIFDELLPHLDVVALDHQGCHVVRTLIEHSSVEFIETLVPHLAPKTVVELALISQHTRRVLQAIFERHKSEAFTPLVIIIAQHSQELAVSQQGCIALIHVIENALPHQRRLVISKLLPVLPSLAVCCFGNYVVQCILRHMDQASVVSVVCPAFSGHWLALSCNKFASNVIEKVVWQIDEIARRAVVQELIFDMNNLRCLIQDKFGNFVLQAIIGSSNDAAEFGEISYHVRPLLHTSPYGQKIENRLQDGLVRLMRMAQGPHIHSVIP